VTDDKDEILIKTLLDDYYTEKIFDDDYRFGPGDTYYAPATGEY